MKTGKHEEVKQFISSHSLQDQTFDLESEYYRLHNYDLESYDRRLAIVDVRHDNHRLKDNDEFQIEVYLNKNPRRNRVKMFEKLSNTGTLKKSLYTYWPDRKLPKEYELPWAQDYPPYGMDQDIYEKPYNDTACSIVSETNDNDTEIFMTEKIWKPIIAQHIFIVHGNYLYLQRLREMGFRTFNNYFEEVYDLDRDPDMRINTIADVCDRLRDAPWQDIYLQTKALRQYNYDNFFNKEKLSLEINKTLNLFLEFADSSQITS
jgi:hypothetical protein